MSPCELCRRPGMNVGPSLLQPAWMLLAIVEIIAFTKLARGRVMTDEERLMDTLFHDYNLAARPVLNSSDTVRVQVQFSLMHIKDLDVRSQILTTTGLLILDWKDERLTWSPRKHNNLTEVIVEAASLWRPEFAVINGAEKIYENYNQFRAVVSFDGHVHWEPGGVYKTMCQIDITYYPFDDQQCKLNFGAWSYHTTKMNLTNSSGEVNLDSYKENGEWEISSTLIVRQEFAYACCPDEIYSFVSANLYLRRRHTFYILNVILPSIMTSVLLLSIFFCTPGQKMQIGVVVLLSFRIFLLNVAGNIPKTSDHIPLLGIYLTCTMAITTLSMVLTVFVLNLHHVNDRPVPTWLRRFALVYLARTMGMCGAASNEEEDLRRKARAKRRMPRVRRASVQLDSCEEGATLIQMQTFSSSANGESVMMRVRPSESTYTDSDTPGDTPVHRPKIEAKPEKEKKETPDYSKEWVAIAEIFDRLFFWLFLLAIVVSTLVLFHPLTSAYIYRGANE